MNIVGVVAFRNLIIGKLTQSELKESDMKSALRMQYLRLCESQIKFSSVSLYNQSFSRYCTFYGFLADSHLKISKWHIFFF